MRRHLLFAAIGAAGALMAAFDSAAADGRVGSVQAGGGGGGGAMHSPPASSGSSGRSAAPAAPQQVNGGWSGGGRLPAVTTSSPPRPAPIVRGSAPAAPATYPRTSLPMYVSPARPGPSTVVHPPVTMPSRVGGEGFINIPHGPAAGAGLARVPAPPTLQVRSGNAVQPGVQNLPSGPKLTRGLGAAAGVTVGVGAMPAIAEHLQKHGQNLQTWSANRDQAFNQAHQQSAPQLQQFQQNRDARWNQLRGRSSDRIRMALERGADWQGYRRDLWRFRHDRATEIRDHLRNGFDDLFTADWWRLHHGRNFVLGSFSPWWWWNPCPWNSLVSFGGYGWSSPIYYDYDANVAVADDTYVDGQDWGPSADYAQQAIDLANPPVAAEEPAPPSPGEPDEWQPFGVFALTQEENGDAVLFFQLAMNKNGLIGGAFTNTLTDETAPITGSIDRNTQRAAWHVGDKTDTVYEVGVANLTLDVAPVLIHFGTREAQTWLLVRLPSPDLPSAPAPVTAPVPP